MSLTLVIDTAAGRCAVGLIRSGDSVATREAIMGKGHAEALFPMIRETLAAADAPVSDVSLIAVSTGPGNMTGARIGCAAARGLALSTGATAIGVDRFAAMAEGRSGVICVALQGRGGAVHVARYEGGEAVRPAETLQAQDAVDYAHGADLIGDASATLRDLGGAGAVIDTAADAPLIAYAKVAERLADHGASRPAPLYLRPVAAALPKTPPPRLLT